MKVSFKVSENTWLQKNETSMFLQCLFGFWETQVSMEQKVGMEAMAES